MEPRKQEERIISSLDFEKIMRQIKVAEEEYSNAIENIQDLKRKVLTAQKVNPQEMLANIVTMGSLVEIKTDYDDFTFKLTLVYPEFENVRENKVSVFSNLGSAIFLQKTNDIISYYTWEKEHTIKILDIHNQSEADGNFIT
ncbi:GreA/GreB family elongation factor [uncultured Draconibacterium sp.]|uniref:GreA/GreB family elongation factor n=1 Tax=uncultured Draconibacterium sp. TaxID=1573823 RepID=UPI0025D70841|nr:GreA/GreB family elongation factor [uncultured Draconibacterium sp.]